MLDRMHFSGTWREYQARILEEMDEHLGDKRLHVVASPGAGKTVLGLEIVRKLGLPALVFAPSLAIRDQWRERLSPLFMPELPGDADVSRDLSDPRVLTLATYQSLDSFRRRDDLTELIESLNERGGFTLVLDEAHHLRRAWWQCLNRLASELDQAVIVALTATPPYDASLAEWNRYENLCGPIDLEIGIPELVRNGDLCPHQDHLLLSEPTEDALALLKRRREAISDLQQDPLADESLLELLESHSWLTDPEDHIEAILDAPQMLSAILVQLGAAGRKLPPAPLRLLGVRSKDLPRLSQFWLERLLEGLLFEHKDSFLLDPERRKALEDRLHKHGLIEGGKVRLYHTRSVFRLLASSLAKLDSISRIAKAEQSELGDAMRMVVLSDHIRAGELPRSADSEFKPAKLGVIPIFESLRRAGAGEDRLGVLTGSLVIVPSASLVAIEEIAGEIGLDSASIRSKPIKACRGYAELGAAGGSSADLIRLVTALFMRGHIRILVGTQALLGQGWDAPALNSLVLASNTASFMLSNQMRGRAIRIDPGEPAKVANIWHLATIEPGHEGLIDALANALDWGIFNDPDRSSLSDIGVVARRFRAFEGISNGSSNLIESGLGRLNLDPGLSLERQNALTMAHAADRSGIASKWQRSLGDGEARSQVRETAAPNYAPRGLSWTDTLQALIWTAAATGGFAAAEQLRSIATLEGAAIAGMVATGAGAVASLPSLVKAVRLKWRNGSLEGSLNEVAETVLASLAAAEIVPDAALYDAQVEIRSSVDGRKDIVVTGVSRSVERLVMQALAEILGPVQNPRYLLVRKSLLGAVGRTDYHAVPTVLGSRFENAAIFANEWRNRIGSSQLVYTRDTQGRRVLLQARMRSFAAGFQRSVDRRSAWL